MRRSLSFLSVLVIPALTGCATLAVQPDRVKTVKSVAVVGYTALWEQTASSSNSRVGGTANAIKAISRSASGEAQAEREERAQATYDLLVDTLKNKMSWSVLDRETLGQSSPYQETVQARGPHPGGGMFSANNRYLFVDGVLRQEDVRRMSIEERRKLMEALQVDAIAHVYVHFKTVNSGFAVGGLGNVKQHPVARVEFVLFDHDSEEPIWEERNAQGRRAEKMVSQDIAGVSVMREAVEAVVEAAGYGYEEMISRFQQYQP